MNPKIVEKTRDTESTPTSCFKDFVNKCRSMRLSFILNNSWKTIFSANIVNEWVLGTLIGTVYVTTDYGIIPVNAPKRPTLPVILPELYKDFSKWNGNILEFMKYRLFCITSKEHTCPKTCRAFLRRIRDYDVYAFSGKAEIYLESINLIRVVSETLDICGVSMDAQTITEIVKSNFTYYQAWALLNYDDNTIRNALDIILNDIANAVYAKINVAIAA